LQALSQWLKTGGRSGACPDWYRILVSTEGLQCPPWVLTGEDPPCVLYWRDRALHRSRLEAEAVAWRREHKGWD
jgi:hypothetical protein